MKAHHFVSSGTERSRLAVYEAGRRDAPLVLLVHGWAQSARCWHRQLTDPELTAALHLVAVDLRGHGCSEAPDHGYDNLAGDVHAVLTAFGQPATLVGWSYGGLAIADYLGRYGATLVDGVLLTGAITGIGRGVPAGRVGPVMRAALPDALAEDPKIATPALAAFVAAMTPQPLPGEEEQGMVAAALATPPRVRAALFDRHADGAQLVDAITATPRPILVQHGTRDPVVDASAAEHHLATIQGAEADWWNGAGHLPFAEDPSRFNRTLRTFVGQCAGDRGRISR